MLLPWARRKTHLKTKLKFLPYNWRMLNSVQLDITSLIAAYWVCLACRWLSILLIPDLIKTNLINTNAVNIFPCYIVDMFIISPQGHEGLNNACTYQCCVLVYIICSPGILSRIKLRSTFSMRNIFVVKEILLGEIKRGINI